MRIGPAPAVLDWVLRQDQNDLFTTAVTLAEIHYGLERLPAGRRRSELLGKAEELFGAFETQVLAFDSRAASEYGKIVHAREMLGNPIDGFDAQIASICRAHQATLATRNIKDFASTGVELIDPWLGD